MGRGDAKPNAKQSKVIVFFFFRFLQYNVEHRQREMEEQKREQLQQLIRKNKDEQSESGHRSPGSNLFSCISRKAADSL